MRRLLPSWRHCYRSSRWSLLPFSLSVSRCRCSRFMCTKAWASAPSWLAWSPARSSPRPCSHGSGQATSPTAGAPSAQPSRPAGRRGGWAALSPIASIRRRAGDISHYPPPGAGGARRSGALHRHRGVQLGAGARGPTEHWPDHGLGRDSDVRRLRGRRASGHQPIRRPLLRGDRDRNGADPAWSPCCSLRHVAP